MSSETQRQKRRAKRGKRKLIGLVVDEISLVDRPAVPKATFVIAKRDEEAVAVTDKPEVKIELEFTDRDKVGAGTGTETAKAAEVTIEDALDAQGHGSQLDNVVEAASRKVNGLEADLGLSTATSDGASTAGDLDTVTGNSTAKTEPDGDTEVEEGTVVEEPVAKAADSWLKAIKILRGSAGDLDPPGLHLLASVIEYTAFRYAGDEKVKEELFKVCDGDPLEFARNKSAAEAEELEGDVEKATRVLGPTGFGKIESAANEIAQRAATILDVAKGARTITKEEEPEPEHETDNQTAAVETAEPTIVKRSVLAQAGDLWLAKQRQAEATETQKLNTKLAQLVPRLESVLDRQTKFTERVDTARGKV